MKMLSGRVAVPGDPPHGRVAILVGCLSLGRLDAGGHATASGDRAVGQGGRLQRVSYSSGPITGPSCRLPCRMVGQNGDVVGVAGFRIA